MEKDQLSRLVTWVICWGIGVVIVGTQLLGQPAFYLIFALLLVFVFAMVNGISQGLTDWNPISSAFVVTVVLMAELGLKDPVVGLMAGTARAIAGRHQCGQRHAAGPVYRLPARNEPHLPVSLQVAGIVMGAMTGVGFAKLFMTAYPILQQDQTVMSAAQQPAAWSSAMTYKFVGALRSLTDNKTYQHTAILAGMAIGFATELARKLIAANSRYRAYIKPGGVAQAVDFTIFGVLLPSPYASSFGGFVNLPTSAWFAAGSVVSEVAEWGLKRTRNGAQSTLPSDMSITSLVGGGFIAGDAIAALGIGVYGLLSTVFAG